MRLLYITNNINGSGGLERVLSIKASRLAEDYRYEVHILVFNNAYKNPFYEFSKQIQFHSIDVGGNSLSYFIKYKKGIKDVLKNVKPDIISVCDDGFKGLLFPLVFGKNVPVVYERHAAINLNFNTSNNFLVKIKNHLLYRVMVFGAKRFDAFILLTNGNKKDWKGVICRVIPNPSPFNTKDDEFVRGDSKMVIAVGSQSFNKGYDQLFLSWKLVSKVYPDWQLKIYGKENLALNLQKEINNLNLQSSVFLKKPIMAIENAYKSAAIYVMPSRSEGFGMVLIEAMSFGVPCISFDCPHGPADIITNGKDGVLIKNGDIEGFANAIITLIENKKQRISMGSAAKASVQRYAPEKILQEWNVLFKNLSS